MTGMVYLIGAGPGDYGLLTLKAAEALRRAEVVVYDHLADEQLLRLAPPGAELIYAGKTAGNHTLKQSEISRLLAEKAKQGKLTVRLKGGDPFVFGRGGEEALLLRENNIPFEIVPGVSSATAVPAYAGIPVTHRGIAASFAVVTGHEAPDKENSDIHWEGLATAVDTLVFLMGVAHLPEITARLIACGRPAATPAALIRQGTKPEQEVITTTLGGAAEAAKRAELKPPAVFIVGEVVRLREKLDWFGCLAEKPLFGRRVLVTRAREQASSLTERLEQLGAEVAELPAIRLAPPEDSYAALDAAISRLEDFSWIIFTSVNGVDAFFARLAAAGLDSRALYRARLAVIGPATAERLKKYGIAADIVPEEFRAEGLLQVLAGKVTAGTPVLTVRAEGARAVLADGLHRLGAELTEAAAYRTVCDGKNAEAVKRMLAAGEIDYITFTSSSTVVNLRQLIAADLLKTAKIVCIGPVTAGTCRSNGLEPCIVAENYTIDGLVAAILEEEKINGRAFIAAAAAAGK